MINSIIALFNKPLIISVGMIAVIMILLLVALLLNIRDYKKINNSMFMNKIIPKRFSLTQYHINGDKPNELNIMSFMTVDNMFDPAMIVKNPFKVGLDENSFERCAEVLLDDIATTITLSKEVYIENGFDNMINVTITILSYQYSIIAKANYNLESNNFEFNDVNGYQTINIFDGIINCASEITNSLHKGDE